MAGPVQGAVPEGVQPPPEPQGGQLGRYTPVPFCFHPLTSCQCLPLAKGNQRLAGKGVQRIVQGLILPLLWAGHGSRGADEDQQPRRWLEVDGEDVLPGFPKRKKDYPGNSDHWKHHSEQKNLTFCLAFSLFWCFPHPVHFFLSPLLPTISSYLVQHSHKHLGRSRQCLRFRTEPSWLGSDCSWPWALVAVCALMLFHCYVYVCKGRLPVHMS